MHFIWKPYALYVSSNYSRLYMHFPFQFQLPHSNLICSFERYGTIDYVYGWPAYNEKDGFPAAQSFLTLVEAIFMSVYIYTSYFTKSPSTRLTGAFIGLIAATSCFSKTVLYMLCEYFSGYKYVGHNPLPTLVMLYLIPSAPWIFMNFYSMLAIAGQLKSALMSIPSETDKKTK